MSLPREWNSSLLVCSSSDLDRQYRMHTRRICLLGAFCPFILAGMNKAAADGRSLTLCDILCCPSEFHTRQQIRSVHRMDQNYGADCLAICLCWCCAICQDAREIEIRSKIIYLGYPPQTMPAK